MGNVPDDCSTKDSSDLRKGKFKSISVPMSRNSNALKPVGRITDQDNVTRGALLDVGNVPCVNGGSKNAKESSKAQGSSKASKKKSANPSCENEEPVVKVGKVRKSKVTEVNAAESLVEVNKTSKSKVHEIENEIPPTPEEPPSEGGRSRRRAASGVVS